MKTVATILELAAPLQAGFHIRIENEPWMTLVIEDTQERGPNGLLDMTFHPKFRENRKYYLKYQIFEDGKVATIIVEKKFAVDFKSDSARSASTSRNVSLSASCNSGSVSIKSRK